MKPTPSFLPWLALFTIYVVWGSTYLAIRIVVHDMPPFAAASVRFLLAGLIMGLAARHFDRGQGWPTRRQWLDYGLVGLLLLAFGNGLVMWAERTVPSGIAALVVATVPLWLTLMEGVLSRGASWTARAWLGIAIGLLGVAFVAEPGGADFAAQWPGILALQVAALTWCAGSLYVKRVPHKLPVVSASAVQMLVGGAALVLESLAKGEDWSLMLAAPPAAWGGLLYLVIAGSLIGFTAFAYCLTVMPASVVGTYAYVNPVVAVALGFLILDEPLTRGVLWGGAMIVLAVVLATTGTKPVQSPSTPQAEPERKAA